MPAEEEKASGGMRALVLLATVALLIGTAVMAILVINPDGTPLCEDVNRTMAGVECFDVPEVQFTISRVVAGVAGFLGVIAVLLGISVAVTGTRGPLFLRLGVAAVVLGGLAVLIIRL